MSDPLVTYLNDHLAGARFAVSLLKDLSAQRSDVSLAEFSTTLLKEVEEDQAKLSDCVSALGGGPSMLKEATAWIAQKAGKSKFAVEESLGQFEAIEMLMLGVSGKLALWQALLDISRPDMTLSQAELRDLARRAHDQQARLQTLRLELARRALLQPHE